jgi:threonine/homoserine/homoserine lactone efflux protein
VGLALGTLAVLAAVAAGFVSLVSTVPMASLLIRIVGIAYILYLAWQIAIAPPLTTDTNEASTPTLSAGVLLGVANPKAYFAISAVLASTTLMPGEPVADAMLKIGMLAVLIVLIQATWLLLGLLLARLMADPSRSRPMNIGMALLLVASAIGSMWP